MASKIEKTVKDCDKPKDPNGPYVTYCAYEFIALYDCRAAGSEQESRAGASVQVAEGGTIGSYTGGGDGTATGTVAKVALQEFSRGSPIAVVFMGLLSDGWTEYFVGGDPATNRFIGNWFATPQHNYLPERYRIKLCKYIHVEMHMLSKEDLYGDNEPKEGNEIWKCPANPTFRSSITADPGGGVSVNPEANIPLPEASDFPACPPYYKLQPCTDCTGHTGDMRDEIFEMADGRPIVADVNDDVIEYPEDSNKCYNWVRVTPDRVTAPKIIKINQQGDGYDAMKSCQSCKMGYWIVAVAPVNAVDQNPPDSLMWLPEQILNFAIRGVPNAALQAILVAAIESGNMRISRMAKIPVNQQFVQAWGPKFVYKGTDNICYRVYIFDDNEIAKPPAQGCVPSILSQWTFFSYDSVNNRVIQGTTPNYLGAGSFFGLNLWKDGAAGIASTCLCQQAGGIIGTSEYNKCYPLDPPPQILSLTPNPGIIKISRALRNKTITFDVRATGIGLTYEWFHNYRGRTYKLASVGTSVSITKNWDKNADDHDGRNVFNEVWCEVSNNGGRTKVSTVKAPIKIIMEPHKLYPDDKMVWVVTCKVWCLSQNEAEALIHRQWPTRRFKGLNTPSTEPDNSIIKYIPPADDGGWDAEVAGSWPRDADGNEQRWFIGNGKDGICNKRYTVLYASKAVRTRWEDVHDWMKGIVPPSLDENADDEVRLMPPAYSQKEWYGTKSEEVGNKFNFPIGWDS